MASASCTFELPRQCTLSKGHDGPHVTYPDQRITELERENRTLRRTIVLQAEEAAAMSATDGEGEESDTNPEPLGSKPATQPTTHNNEWKEQ